MISGRSLLLVFGTVLFFVLGFAGYLSDFNIFGPSWRTPAEKSWMAHYNLWFAIGFLYLVLAALSVMRDFNRRKKPH